MALANELMFKSIKEKYFQKWHDCHTVYQPYEFLPSEPRFECKVFNYHSLSIPIECSTELLEYSEFAGFFEVPESELPFDPETLQPRTKESKLAYALHSTQIQPRALHNSPHFGLAPLPDEDW